VTALYLQEQPSGTERLLTVAIASLRRISRKRKRSGRGERIFRDVGQRALAPEQT